MMREAKEYLFIGFLVMLCIIGWIFAIWETELNFVEMLVLIITNGPFWYAFSVVCLVIAGIWFAFGPFVQARNEQ